MCNIQPGYSVKVKKQSSNIALFALVAFGAMFLITIFSLTVALIVLARAA